LVPSGAGKNLNTVDCVADGKSSATVRDGVNHHVPDNPLVLRKLGGTPVNGDRQPLVLDLDVMDPLQIIRAPQCQYARGVPGSKSRFIDEPDSGPHDFHSMVAGIHNSENSNKRSNILRGASADNPDCDPSRFEKLFQYTADSNIERRKCGIGNNG